MSGIFIRQVRKSYDICFNQPDEVVVGGKQTPWTNFLQYVYMKLIKTNNQPENLFSCSSFLDDI